MTPGTEQGGEAAGARGAGSLGGSPGPGRSARPWANPAPPLLGILGALIGAVFALLRTEVAGRGDVARLILVGRRFGNPARLRPGIPVVPGSGYDGQFYYRLALDPLDLSRSAFGITFDSLERPGRIAYPALVWLVSLGHWSFVPVALVVVNVCCLGALSGLAAELARRSGRSSWWGLVVAGYFGFLWTLGRDLTELTAAAFLLGGLLALRSGRPWLAGALLAVAALGRETELLAAGCVALVDLASRWRRWVGAPDASTPGARSARARLVGLLERLGVPAEPIGLGAWVVPAAVFVGWQLAVVALTGHSPLKRSGSANLAPPLVGLVHGLAHYLPELPTPAADIWTVEVLALGALSALAALCLRRSQVPVWEKLLWVGSLLVVLCVAKGIWLGNVGLRSFDDLYLMSWLVLLGTPGTRRAPTVAPSPGSSPGSSARLGWWPALTRLLALGCGLVWLGVFVQLVRFI